MDGICRVCGELGSGEEFDRWARPTFTDWDKLQPGTIICDSCAWWFQERSEELQAKTGRDKPQCFRNYSHFIVNGEWIPLTKGDKRQMRELLLGEPFPELAAVAESGQKHIVFRARRNAPGERAGWVQFEEDALWLEPDELAALLADIEALYVGFTKAEIETGQYVQYFVLQFGFDAWRALEAKVAPARSGLLFKLALFLAQREENDGGKGGQSIGDDLEGSASGLQEPVPDDDLAAIRGSDSERGVHGQSGEVCQLALL